MIGKPSIFGCLFLSLLFIISAPPAVSESSAGDATAFKTVSVATTKFGAKITIKADGRISNYIAFTIEKPARIVFDLYRIRSPFKKTKVIGTDSKWLRAIRHYGHPDKVRVVLDTWPAYLSSYKAASLSDGLEIVMGEMDLTREPEAREAAAAEPDTPPVTDAGPDSQEIVMGKEGSVHHAGSRGDAGSGNRHAAAPLYR